MRTEILNIIKQFSGQTAILTIPRPFIDYTGSLESALVLSQLLFLTKEADEEGWICMGYDKFEKEISLNEYQVRKAKNKLERMEILETKLKKVDGSPMIHFRIKEANFSESILQFLKNPICKNERNFKESENFEETIREEEKRELKERESNAREESEKVEETKSPLSEIITNSDEKLTDEEYRSLSPENKISEITKMFIRTWGGNPKFPQIEATVKLIEKFGYNKTQNLMRKGCLIFKFFNQNFLDSIDETGNIKPLFKNKSSPGLLTYHEMLEGTEKMSQDERVKHQQKYEVVKNGEKTYWKLKEVG